MESPSDVFSYTTFPGPVFGPRLHFRFETAPSTKSEIKIAFDEGEDFELKSYFPDDKKSKESRIFGLAKWFAQHEVVPGERLTISVIDNRNCTYRLILDRYLRGQQEFRARQALKSAPNDEFALEQLDLFAKITKKGMRRAAKELLRELATESTFRPRSQVQVSQGSHRAVVSPAIRVLLRELHRGKCQLCSFTFEKKNGGPYFEVHHLAPEYGDHPANLLVVCPNCHAKLEYARVEGFERVGGWLVAIRINDKRLTIRQPLSSIQLGATRLPLQRK